MNNTDNVFNILVCGSPRVGKSSLINALCQRKLVKTIQTLDSCTSYVECYTLRAKEDSPTYFEINFWDSPGIDSWRAEDVLSFMSEILHQIQPICMIYCASPGSFAKLDQLEIIANACIDRKILCAFVVTNMWSGSNQQIIMNDFKSLFKCRTTQKEIQEDEVVYFDRIGLCAMVNSTTYVDNMFGINKPVQGINELIFGIAKCLESEQLLGWFYAVAENESFWMTMGHKVKGLISVFGGIINDACNYIYEKITLDTSLQTPTMTQRQISSINNSSAHEYNGMKCIKPTNVSTEEKMTETETNTKIKIELTSTNDINLETLTYYLTSTYNTRLSDISWQSETTAIISFHKQAAATNMLEQWNLFRHMHLKPFEQEQISDDISSEAAHGEDEN